MKKVNRRSALKVMGGAAGSLILGGQASANDSLPVAVFVTENKLAGRALRECGFEWFRRTVLANGDDILGEWQTIEPKTARWMPSIIADLAYDGDGVWYGCPFTQRPLVLQRSNKVFVKKEDALLCLGKTTIEPYKAWGPIQITETRSLIPPDANLTNPLPENFYKQITGFKILPDSQLFYLE